MRWLNMNPEEKAEILDWLDLERRTVVYPGVKRIVEAGVIKDISADGKGCEVVYSSSNAEDVDRIIAHQIETARSLRYALEWKVYGHDQPSYLAERLTSAGFEAGDKEAFLVFRADLESLDQFGTRDSDIRRVTTKEALNDYKIISEEVLGESCARQVEQYWHMLENYPENLSVYVTYIDGVPAACGRIYFHEASRFAALYGGQTRERFRKRGLFTQVVAARIQEALDRGITHLCVDALPTSEPILRGCGFEFLTYTQPFFLIELSTLARPA